MKKTSLILASSLLLISSVQAISLDDLMNKETALKITAAGIIGVVGYKISKNLLDTYLEDILIEKTVNAITVAATPEFLIPKEDLQKTLKEKARLIAMRKRILTQLSQKIEHDLTLSKKHRDHLKRTIKIAKTLFAVMDALRKKNPYENENNDLSYLEQYVEDSIVQSIILRYKPIEECSSMELAKKENGKKRQQRILNKLNGILINGSTNSSLNALVSLLF